MLISIVSFFVHFIYGMMRALKTLYIVLRLTLNEKHDYFFKLMYKLYSDKNSIISINGDSGVYFIVIVDDSGRTYLIDVDLIKNKFIMTMKSIYADCIIYGDDLNDNDINKFNKLIDFFKFKENGRKFLNEFRIEKYKNK